MQPTEKQILEAKLAELNKQESKDINLNINVNDGKEKIIKVEETKMEKDQYEKEIKELKENLLKKEESLQFKDKEFEDTIAKAIEVEKENWDKNQEAKEFKSSLGEKYNISDTSLEFFNSKIVNDTNDKEEIEKEFSNYIVAQGIKAKTEKEISSSQMPFIDKGDLGDKNPVDDIIESVFNKS